MERVKLHDKEFELFISREQIKEAVRNVATQLEPELKFKNPVFVVVLGGAFLFAADLVREVPFTCEISFVRVSSYEGTDSTGVVKEVLGLNQDISDRHVVIVEDIVDTGKTIEVLAEKIYSLYPASVRIATFLFKPNAYKGTKRVDFKGIEIPDDFVVGYGLDYNGQGRNLDQIYRLVAP